MHRGSKWLGGRGRRSAGGVTSGLDASPLAVTQDVIVSSERIRDELGYVEDVRLGEGLQRTVTWTRANPPTTEPLDYSIEDRLLAGLAT
jgi:nucleoside-diphosphate-sugar epimerase